MKTYSASGFWRNIMLCPVDHGLLSAQRVDFQLNKSLKLYHTVMAKHAGSSVTDAVVDFSERDPENSTLATAHDLTAAL